MNFDILITGAGPSGLSFARLAADAGLKIGIVEKQPEKSVANPAYDGREIALTHLSHRIMRECGMWERIPDRAISRIREAKVLNGDSPYALHFDALEAGKQNLGFMISNHLIRKSAYEAAMDCKNVTLISGVEVKKAKTDTKGAHIDLLNGKKLTARLLVAADSRFSTLRDMMDIDTAKLDFKRTCIVSKMKISKSHHYVAYECFHNDRTVAILPLSDDHCSIVITCDTDEGDDIVNMHPDDFARDIEGRVENKLGAMELVTERYAYPLVSVYADTFYKNRFALMGDAAVGMHPVTAHGFNFGLRGGHTLANLIIDGLKVGLDIADETILSRYNEEHRKATWMMYQGTNTLVKLYTDRRPLAKIARGALLRLGNKLPPARDMILKQLTEAEVTP